MGWGCTSKVTWLRWVWGRGPFCLPTLEALPVVCTAELVPRYPGWCLPHSVFSLVHHW